MANPYDVNMVFAELEQELILSFKRNMHKYVNTSDMWQAMKMKDLEQYRRETAREIAKATKQAKQMAKIVIKDEFTAGADKVDAFMKQFKLAVKPTSEHDFFRLNRRKLNAMLEAVYGDLDRASHAIYRQMDDVYRQTLFKAEIAKNSGVFTPEQAMDVATKDFLEKGVNCIRYSNGNLVNIASYAEMVIRTSGKRAQMVAEGARNQEWGVTTIQITQHGSTCELCSPWQGRVLIDDVYSGGKPEDGPYPLLSQAMAEGLFHPNCRHGSGTYFEGISNAPEPYDRAEVEAKYEVEQQQRYNERKIREWKRKANGSMDEGNKRKAEAKVKYWQGRQRQLLDENDWLRRNYSREKVFNTPTPVAKPKLKSPEQLEKAINLLPSVDYFGRVQETYGDKAKNPLPVVSKEVSTGVDSKLRKYSEQAENGFTIWNDDKYSKYAELAPKELRTQQDVVSRENMKEVSKLDWDSLSKMGQKDDINVVKYQGQYIVVDGNHRSAVSLLRGDSSLRVRLISLD